MLKKLMYALVHTRAASLHAARARARHRGGKALITRNAGEFLYQRVERRVVDVHKRTRQ